MPWIDAEELIRAAQLEDEDAELIDYLLTFAQLWEPEIVDSEEVQREPNTAESVQGQADRWQHRQADPM